MSLMSRGLLLSVLLACSCLSVQASPTCAQPGKDGFTFVGNSLYPGIGTASGNTVNLGSLSSNGANVPIAAGDEILIIQMQDADINAAGGDLTNTNTTTYGDGSTGRGYTALNNVGRYEFAVVQSVSGSVLTLRDPLKYSYRASPATATGVRRSFQVLRVPQYSSLTLTSGLTVPAWNGQTGGVLVLDVAGTLNLNGQTINADGAGFRGGGSFLGGSLTGLQASDYANVYNTTSSRGAMKGEGYAGTPSLVRGTVISNGYSGTTAGLATGDQGYPNAFVVARGAPGNAGGGSTQHNTGGGGGGNVGAGGKGGFSFGFYSTTYTGNTCRTLTSGTTTYYSCGGDGSRDVGGLGGVGFTPDATRLIAGGGGGAGDNNNASDNPTTPQSSGGNGGGIIIIRAGAITGSGTLSANGQNGQNAGRDGAGGGGAGGSVALIVPAGTFSGLSVSAKGGAGGNSGLPLRGNETQGPGGGGGGGAILLAAGVTVGSANVSGGAAGINTPVQGITNNFGTAGGSGGNGQLAFSNENAPLPDLCVPQLTVTKTTSTPTRFTNSTAATYTITVSNAAGRSEAQNVTISDPALPVNFTYASTNSVTLSGNATRPTTTNPSAGTPSPSWSSFTLPGGASVSLSFQVNLSSPTPGTYQNAAQVTYLSPTRTTSSGTATAQYAPASSTAEDITVYTLPKVVLEKWVRNVTRNNGFSTQETGYPGDIMEYCINFRNNGGYAANNFKLTDVVPLNTTAQTDAYGPGQGVWLSSGIQVNAGDKLPAGTALTSATDTDAASLNSSLLYQTDLTAGAKGVVCFQAKVK